MALKFDFGYFYTVEKPINERRFKYEKWWYFVLKERNGNEVAFSNKHEEPLVRYRGKVLTNPKTGDEICFLTINGAKYMLEAKKGHSEGRRLTDHDLDNLVVDVEWSDSKGKFVKSKHEGITLREFFKKKAEERHKKG